MRSASRATDMTALRSKMRIETYQVDAFTRVPFTGNPAAVCLLTLGCLPLPDGTRQAVAAEMNLSETAFVEPLEASSSSNSSSAFTDSSRFKLRWFTPTAEVPLCGHATLAAACVLFKEKGNSNQRLEFETLSGVLTVQQGVQGSTPVLQMDLPLTSPHDPLPQSLQSQSQLQQLLTASVGQMGVKAVQYNAALKYVLLVLEAAEPGALAALRPDPGQLLAAVSSTEASGLIVTCQGAASAADPYDFHSRFLGPWLGIPEDPVTGSAHSVLAAYWSAQLDKDAMLARQCSPRGGDVWVSMGPGPGRVTVSGEGVVVLRGELTL